MCTRFGNKILVRDHQIPWPNITKSLITSPMHAEVLNLRKLKQKRSQQKAQKSSHNV